MSNNQPMYTPTPGGSMPDHHPVQHPLPQPYEKIHAAAHVKRLMVIWIIVTLGGLLFDLQNPFLIPALLNQHSVQTVPEWWVMMTIIRTILDYVIPILCAVLILCRKRHIAWLSLIYCGYRLITNLRNYIFIWTNYSFEPDAQQIYFFMVFVYGIVCSLLVLFSPKLRLYFKKQEPYMAPYAQPNPAQQNPAMSQGWYGFNQDSWNGSSQQNASNPGNASTASGGQWDAFGQKTDDSHKEPFT